MFIEHLNNNKILSKNKFKILWKNLNFFDLNLNTKKSIDINNNINNSFNDIHVKFYIRSGLCGYSYVAKNIINSMYNLGVNITTTILLKNEINGKTEKDELVLNLQNNKDKYDYVIIHDYPFYGKI